MVGMSGHKCYITPAGVAACFGTFSFCSDWVMRQLFSTTGSADLSQQERHAFETINSKQIVEIYKHDSHTNT